METTPKLPVEFRLYPYLVDIIFVLAFLINILGILLFLKMSLYAVPFLAFILGIDFWLLIYDDKIGFIPIETGLKPHFSGWQMVVMVLLSVAQFGLGLVATMSM